MLQVSLVPSEKNKADVLTRVKKAWLNMPGETGVPSAMVCCAGGLNLREEHGFHHMGVDRTLYLAR